MYYIVLLIFHRRDAEEQREMLAIVNETVSDHSRREEVGKMGRAAAQTLIEEGTLRTRKETLLELMQGRFGAVPPKIESDIQTIRDIAEWHGLKQKVVNSTRVMTVCGVILTE